MRVLVTGCCGFIGGHLVDRLVTDGQQVWGLDARTYAAASWDHVEALLGTGPPGSPCLFEGDITRPGDIKAAMGHAVPDVVFHLAAESHVDASLEAPGRSFRVNAVGTHNVAMACAQAEPVLVYCSTDEVYGDLSGRGYDHADETAPLAPSSPYSAGKAAGEMAVRAACRSFGLRAVITRGCNAFGPRQYPEKLVPILCHLLQRGAPVSLHDDGRPVRQWVHVSEFVDALARAGVWSLLLQPGELEVFNIAGPARLSVRRLAEAFARQLHLEPGGVLKRRGRRPGQDMAYGVDPGKAREVLDFQARRWVTDPDEIRELFAAYPPVGDVYLSRVG